MPITLTVNLNIAGVSANSISTNGAIVKITGTGFPASWPNKHYNRMALAVNTTNLGLDIVSISTT